MQYKNWVAIAPHLLCIPYCLLAYWLIGRKIKRDERYEPSKSYSLIMILMTVVILPIAMLENTLWEKGQTLYIIFCIGETIYCFLAVILLYFLYQSTVHTVELQAANTILQERHAQERQLRLLIDAMNAQMHDLKHQMNYLEMTLEEKPEYLEELRNQVGSIQNFYQTGNIFLDVILTEKAMQCQKYRIHFECGITCGQEYAFLSLQDLNALFGNLLDNAITYLRTVPQVEKRYLLIRSSKQGEMLKLKIENYCEDTLCWREDGTPCSTKADTKMHGYGTRNIKSIVASYGGNVIFKTEDMLFKVHILFSGSRL